MTNSQNNNAPIDKGMVVRTVVLAVALINQFLVLNGYSPIPFIEQDIEYAITSALTISASSWAWWKNNNVRYKARRNEQYLKDKGLK
ncbi:phage holin [Psychrobacillus sp. L4]|uniref:phage holin n=1 Tax=Psychrobacillus sp. L4 TaxID=3236892 RepID=UPI0036F33C52